MRKYLYEARTREGEEKRGYVSAGSLAEAKAQVQGEGFLEYTLLDDDNTAQLREAMEAAGFEADAEVDLLGRYHPSAVGLMAIAVRKNWIALVVVLGFAAALWIWGYPVGSLVLVLVCAGTVAFPGWVQWEQNQLYRRFWAADYEGSIRSARRLRRFAKASGLQASMVEMDARIAGALVKLGRKGEADALMNAWQGSDKVPATLVMTKKADLEFLARNWAAYVAAIERIYHAAHEADYAKIDLGQVTARLGDDDERAGALLAAVDNSAMGPLHHAFTEWGRGVLALRAGRNDEALGRLAASVDAMQQMIENPIIWGALSLSTAYLCVAMARTGRGEAARQMFAGVRPIVEWHGEDRLIQWLRAEGLLGAPAPG